jgi:hypothetical protein
LRSGGNYCGCENSARQKNVILLVASVKRAEIN